MAMTSYILSIVVGIIFGSFYGLFYLLQKKRVLDALHAAPSKRDLGLLYAMSLLRIGFIAVLVYLLLLSPSIHFILTIACFLASFWAILLYKKAH